MLLTLVKRIIAHHLRRIFLTLFGIFIVLMSSVFYLTSHYHSHDALEDEASKAMLQHIEETAKNIDMQLQGKLTLLETLANRSIIRCKFGEKDASMEERLDALKQERQRLEKLGFKRFGILTPDGMAFFTSGGQLYLGDKEHFKKALEGKSTVSNVLISQYENEPIYAFTTPIREVNTQTIIGVLFGASEALELSKMIASITYAKSGHAFIIDAKGTIIAHKDFSKVIHQHNLLHSQNPELSHIAYRMIEAKSGRGVFNEDNKQWDIAYTPIAATQWSIALIVPHEEIHARFNNFRDSLFIAFTLVVLITFIIAYILADILTRYQEKLEREKREKDADLLATKNKYETTLYALPDLLFELGLDGTYYECHSPYENLLAAPPHKLIGQKVSDALPPLAATICLNALAEANDIGFSRNKIFELPLEQGTTWFELSIAKKPMQLGDEQPRFIVLSRDITDRKRTEERNYYLANFDYLTGLVNRTQLDNHFNYMISLSKRQKSSFAVLFLDLDQFKEINDNLGHHIGDKLLIETAHRLKFLKRETDVVARLGGDEFVVLLPNTGLEGASEVAQKILRLIAKPYTISQNTLHITVSIGISLYPLDGETMEILSQKADKAMYKAKKAGRNNFSFFE